MCPMYCSDVKRGHNLEAEAKSETDAKILASRPLTSLMHCYESLWGICQKCLQFARSTFVM